MAGTNYYVQSKNPDVYVNFTNEGDFVVNAQLRNTLVLPTDLNLFGKGCELISINDGTVYINLSENGDTPVWQLIGSGTVNSVTGLNTDNTDPTNPVVQISVDSTLGGSGTPSDPLSVIGSGIGSFALDVRVATTAVLAGAPVYDNGVLGVGATLTRGTNGTLGTIDGVSSFTLGDRILVKNQASQLQNGVYEVTTVGSASVKYVLTRTTDADTTAQLDDMVVIPSAGTTNKSSSFGQQTQNPVIGTNNIVFSVLPSVFIKQQTSGTQVANQIPIYTGTALTITKGTSNFTYNPTAKRLVLDATTANVLIGPLSGDTSTLTNSIFIGSSAGETVTNSGAEGSIGIGTSAGASATGEGNISFGYQSGNGTTGDNNINIGIRTGASNTADYGVNIGYEAGLYNAGGGSMNGMNSVFIGKSAGNNAVNGLNSIFIGKDAGKNDTVDNSASGTSILIGDTTSTGGFKNSIAIGTAATNTAVNQLMIGSSGSNITDIRWQGILTSSDMHNNALAQGSATAQQVRSGTYTPTLTNVTNISASTAYPAQWMRIGNVVTVSGKVDIDNTATGASELGISLPVPSNFGNDYELSGSAPGESGGIFDDTGWVKADATNNRAAMQSTALTTASHSHWFQFTYQVI